VLFETNRSPQMGDHTPGHRSGRRHHDEGHGPAEAGRGGPSGAGRHGHGPGGRRGGRPGRPGRGRMARRGDVRAAILTLLADEPMHGYQVISELDARTAGRWRPSAGSIYPTLQQLEDEGLVRSEEIDTRRVFSLTEAGTAEMTRRRDAGRAPWETTGPEDSGPAAELRRLSLALEVAAAQVAEVGSARSVDQAREILDDTRRRLYRLLADDDAPTTKTAAVDADRAEDATEPTV